MALKFPPKECICGKGKGNKTERIAEKAYHRKSDKLIKKMRQMCQPPPELQKGEGLEELVRCPQGGFLYFDNFYEIMPPQDDNSLGPVCTKK